MIKPLTCVCMILAAGSGLYLYQTKHRAQLLDREIGRTLKQTDLARDRIGVLRGEWALLNEPERLAELNQQHLALKMLAPTQFTSVADLGNRLPAPLPQGRPAMIPDEPAAAPEPVQPIAAVARPTGLRAVAATVAALPAAIPATPPASPRAPVVIPPAALPPAAAQVAALPVPPAAISRAPRVAATAVAPPVVLAAVVPHPALPLPAMPMPVLAPRFTAPIVSVSAAPMVVPPAAPARVQGIATHAAVVPAVVEKPGRVRAVAPAISPAYAGGVIPTAAPVMSASGFQGSALGSALGSARPALPAPVPYGAASR